MKTTPTPRGLKIRMGKLERAYERKVDESNRLRYEAVQDGVCGCGACVGCDLDARSRAARAEAEALMAQMIALRAEHGVTCGTLTWIDSPTRALISANID